MHKIIGNYMVKTTEVEGMNFEVLYKQDFERGFINTDVMKPNVSLEEFKIWRDKFMSDVVHDRNKAWDKKEKLECMLQLRGGTSNTNIFSNIIYFECVQDFNKMYTLEEELKCLQEEEMNN
ncbi:hypothetical protein bcgnr5372_64940 [Bacillus luti]|nr:hypothetical protein [Bacillus cereus]HDR8335836.1 hypothetical protein [Bacillus cereus]